MNFSEIFDTNIYVVGGAVRDQLLGLEVYDIDIASALHPKEFKKRCQNLGYKTIDTGIDHGTVTVLINGQAYEHTTFRNDVSCDGRNATISFSDTIEEDLSRRDFTINAIASFNGKLIDPYGGQKDLTNRYLRTVGRASQRFNEDYLRIIRAARFASRLEMTIDPDLQEAAQKLAKNIPTHVSVERIIDEFKKAKKQIENFLKYLDQLSILNELFSFIPSNKNFWFKQCGRAAALGENELFACLFSPLKDKREIESACRKYKLSRNNIKFAMYAKEFLPQISDQSPLATLYAIFQNTGDNFNTLVDYQKALNPTTPLIEVMALQTKFNEVKKTPLISGKDLMDKGIKPSPEFKKILDRAALLQIQGQAKEVIEKVIFS